MHNLREKLTIKALGRLSFQDEEKTQTGGPLLADREGPML
jgi:hypothetical protein